MKRFLSVPLLLLTLLVCTLPARKAPAQAVGPLACTFIKTTIAAIGTSAVVFPNNTPGAFVTPQGNYTITSTGQLQGRKFVTYCVSKDTGQPAGALVRIRLDGTNPTNVITDNSAPLAVGDCVSYPIPASVVPRAISSSATTYTYSFECF